MSDEDFAVITVVKKLVDQIRHTLGTSFSLVDLVRYVEQERKRPLIVIEKFVHTAYLGLCFSFEDFDLIIMNPLIREAGFEDLYAHTVIHEAIHVLRDVAKHIPDNYESFLRRDIMSYELMHNLSVGYNVQFEEDIAESVASEIDVYIPVDKIRERIPLPPELRLLYGYGD